MAQFRNLRQMNPYDSLQGPRLAKVARQAREIQRQRELQKKQQQEDKWTRRGRLMQAIGATLQDVSAGLRGQRGTALSDFTQSQREYNQQLLEKKKWQHMQEAIEDEDTSAIIDMAGSPEEAKIALNMTKKIKDIGKEPTEKRFLTPKDFARRQTAKDVAERKQNITGLFEGGIETSEGVAVNALDAKLNDNEKRELEKHLPQYNRIRKERGQKPLKFKSYGGPLMWDYWKLEEVGEKKSKENEDPLGLR